mmetsp:Transcript_56696/g.184521  ORF Transcript_56696/g.184521 Transcript_56696/m.184521 type:complete len:291 (-) Transcript_56696:979-1851(-)
MRLVATLADVLVPRHAVHLQGVFATRLFDVVGAVDPLPVLIAREAILVKLRAICFHVRSSKRLPTLQTYTQRLSAIATCVISSLFRTTFAKPLSTIALKNAPVQRLFAILALEALVVELIAIKMQILSSQRLATSRAAVRGTAVGTDRRTIGQLLENSDNLCLALATLGVVFECGLLTAFLAIVVLSDWVEGLAQLSLATGTDEALGVVMFAACLCHRAVDVLTTSVAHIVLFGDRPGRTAPRQDSVAGRRADGWLQRAPGPDRRRQRGPRRDSGLVAGRRADGLQRGPR